jgi:D-alanyl-D-alanine dipeptidase
MKNAFPFFVLLFFFNCKNAEVSEPLVVIPADTLELNPVEAAKSKVFVPDYDTVQWVELISLDSSIIIDLKYATTDNFVKEQLYDCARCFLRHEAANQLVKVHKTLANNGYGLKMLDCYRPLPIQQRLWDKFQNPNYVTPPDQGSMHNRGLAVDLTIVDSTGRELDMGTPFDFFGREAHHTFTAFSDTILANRSLLKSMMEINGFKSIRTEWWHYSYSQKMYALSDMQWNCPSIE